MKRYILFVLTIMASMSVMAESPSKNIIIKQEPGSITFVVDEDLTAPENTLMGELRNKIGKYAEERVSAKGTLEKYSGESGYKVLTYDVGEKPLFLQGRQPFFDMMIKAYAEHRPFVITPDAVWLAVSQGFARHVNLNAEELRHMVVSHEGQKPLVIESKGLPDYSDWDWERIFSEFSQQIGESTKEDVYNTITADFSTTGPTERIASQVTLMNCMQKYFTYNIITLTCGIPYITLKGTPEDWQKMVEKVQKLEKYGLGWWTDKLVPVLKEFVKTAKGKPDHQFWRCIVAYIAPDKVRGGGCSTDLPTKFDGWFLNFFPYDDKGRTPQSVTKDWKMQNEMVSVDVINNIVDEDMNVASADSLKFKAGFVGVEENAETYELSPKIGWLVTKKDNEPMVNGQQPTAGVPSKGIDIDIRQYEGITIKEDEK